MPTHEIPPERWNEYLTRLSREAGQRPVSVRLEDPELGDQALGEHLPLVGISCERKGAAAEAIEITLSRPGGEAHLSHAIAEPAHLWVREDAAGQVQVLDIETRERVKTLVMFEGWEALPEPE